MRKIPVKYIGLFSLISLFGGLFHSCTEESREDIPDWVDSKSGILFRTELREGISDKGLLTKLYIFSKKGSGNYLLVDSVRKVVNDSTRLKLKEEDLKEQDYRFLFIATSEQKPEMQVQCTDNTPFAFGTEWEKVAVSMLTDNLSVDNYYGIKDLSGNEILTEGSIDGELSRLVGQMVFCFYKVGPGGITKPLPVDDIKVGSVLDRVSSIDISYKGVARMVTFDENQCPIALAGSNKELKHTVSFTLSADSLATVKLPQEGVPVEIADSIPGGAILKGACLPPSQGGVWVSMTFHYYDTTPVCADTHKHTVECYTPSTLSLNLPIKDAASGLNVLPDHFTINNAGLPCNRIIDILYTAGFTINTTWK